MTDNDNAEPTDTVAEVPEQPQSTEPTDTSVDSSEESNDTDKSGANEARKYRHRAQAAEAERDALRGRLEHMQRSQVERLASAKLTDASDIWRDGAELADLLDENGNIDHSKVDRLASTLVDAHRHWGVHHQSQRNMFNYGMLSGATPPDNLSKRGSGWTSAFSPREE